MEFKEEAWGQYQGKDVKRFTVYHPTSGFLASFTDLGAHSLRVVVKDKNNQLVDVAVTQETPELLINSGAYLGATVGRVANRIGNAEFDLEGVNYKLAKNDGPNHLHGGLIGFDKKIWILEEKTITENEVTLKFVTESVDMDEGYPGKVLVSTKYIINPNKLAWEFKATTDKTTLVNLTNHSYWNLEAIGVPIDDQVVHIEATTYNSVDANGLNTGELFPVEGHMDTHKPIAFKEVFAKFGGVDHNFWLDTAKPYTKDQASLHGCAKVVSPKTGIEMTITTTEPCVQLYTANYLGTNEYKTSNGDKPARPHYAFCLETQKPSNAIHQPANRDLVILKPGDNYFHKTVQEFRVL